MATTTSVAGKTRFNSGAHEFQAPGEDDHRCPCPAINMLANHGYIPRDGKNVTWWDLASGLWNLFGVGLDISGPLLMRVNNKVKTYPWNLHDFQHPTLPVEHNASLTREDLITGADQTKPNKALVEKFLSYARDDGKGGKVIGIAELAKYRKARVEKTLKNYESVKDEPPFRFANIESISGEVAFVLSIFGTGTEIPETLARSMLQEERVPDEFQSHWSIPLPYLLYYKSQFGAALEKEDPKWAEIHKQLAANPGDKTEHSIGK